MSEQAPTHQIPVLSNTTPQQPPPTLPSPMSDIFALLTPSNVLIIVVAAVLAAILIPMFLMFVLRRGGSTPLPRSVRHGDCVGILIDLNSNEVIITPMNKVSSHRYVFTYRKTPYTFIPIEGRPYIVRGLNKPAFLGVIAGEVGMEFNPELFFASGIVKVVSRDLSVDLDSENPKVLEKLILKVTGEQSTAQGRIPTVSGIAFEVVPAKLVTALYKNHIQRTIATLNAMTESWESIEALSKARRTQVAEIGKAIIYVAVALIVVVVALAIARLLGVF